MNRSGDIVILGWKAIRGQSVAHYFTSRHGFTMAVSRCFIQYEHVSNLVSGVFEHCPLCEGMLEIYPAKGGDVDKK